MSNIVKRAANLDSDLIIVSSPARSIGGATIPRSSYTIGFEPMFGIPDLIVTGIRPAVASDLLNAIFTECLAGNIPTLSGETPIGIGVKGEGTTWWAALPNKIEPEHAAWIAPKLKLGTRRRNFRLVQLLLPDARGRFPSHPKCDPLMRSSQNITVSAKQIEASTQPLLTCDN